MSTPGAYALVLGVAGIGGALVLVNILPLVFDLGEDTQFGTYTGLAALPVQAAAVLGPSVAGLVVEATGSQRTLFVVAAVALGSPGSCCSGCTLMLGQVRTIRRAVHQGQGAEGWSAGGSRNRTASPRAVNAGRGERGIMW